MNDKEMRYGFGENWSDFIRKDFSEARLDRAKRHLLDFLKLRDLAGKSVVDIGCGSGLHSLAALRAGAARVVSMDYDEASVGATRTLYELEGHPANWSILQGSVLDDACMESLGQFDIVYSWGVLHHTGEMWRAMDNVCRLMNENALLYISLYTSDVFIRPSPDFWLKTKQFYNGAGRSTQALMEAGYAVLFAPRSLIRHLKHRLVQGDRENRTRGMSFWTDIRDWLGGWPMEFAGIDEVKKFYINERGMALLNMRAGEATTEYLFRKDKGRTHWDDYLARQEMIVLGPHFSHIGGHAWSAQTSLSATTTQPETARLVLYEDATPLGFKLSTPKHTKLHGKGRYYLDENRLVFSTTDNTNPNINGRTYTYYLDAFSTPGPTLIEHS